MTKNTEIADEINKLFDTNYISNSNPTKSITVPKILSEQEPVKKKRGRPAKNWSKVLAHAEKVLVPVESEPIKKKRGRPAGKKNKTVYEVNETKDDKWINYKKSPETIKKMKLAHKKRWELKKRQEEKIYSVPKHTGGAGKKRKPMSPETREKIRQAVISRWEEKHNRENKAIAVISTWEEKNNEKKAIADIGIKVPELSPNCPFCNGQMTKVVKGYYYCEHCNMIINPTIRWKVKLPV